VSKQLEHHRVWFTFRTLVCNDELQFIPTAGISGAQRDLLGLVADAQRDP